MPIHIYIYLLQPFFFPSIVSPLLLNQICEILKTGGSVKSLRHRIRLWVLRSALGVVPLSSEMDNSLSLHQHNVERKWILCNTKLIKDRSLSTSSRIRTREMNKDVWKSSQRRTLSFFHMKNIVHVPDVSLSLTFLVYHFLLSLLNINLVWFIVLDHRLGLTKYLIGYVSG